MLIHLDSSILIAALVDTQPCHAECLQLIGGSDEKGVHTHALSETFSVLTGGRLGFRVPASQAAEVIGDTILSRVEVCEIELSHRIQAFRDAEQRGVRGGAIYDYLHLVCAREAGAEFIYTLNTNDFQALWRSGDPEVKAV